MNGNLAYDFIDPLRENDSYQDAAYDTANDVLDSKSDSVSHAKEWDSFKRLLMQKFPEVKIVPVSQVSVL